MLSFVIPLKSRMVSSDWSEVCRLARKTMLSACNQLDSGFKVVLVCHEVPEWVNEFPRCVVIQAPFPAPDVTNVSSNDRLFWLQTDKGRKILLGVDFCRSSGGGHVMILDADDWVSNRLAGLVASNENCNGWYFESGYRHDTTLPSLLYPRKRFYHECGSSFILHADRMPFPKERDLFRDFNDWYVRRYVVHAYVPDCMAGMGLPLTELPFPGAIYTFNSQNFFANHYRRRDSVFRRLGRIVFKGRLFSVRIRNEFGVRP